MTLLVFLVEDDPAIRANLVESMSGLLDACSPQQSFYSADRFNESSGDL